MARERLEKQKEKTFIVTAPVDYKIKSFEKRVVGDKSCFKEERGKKRGKWSLAKSLLRSIHQLVNPLRGSLGKAIKTESAFIVPRIRLYGSLKDTSVFSLLAFIASLELIKIFLRHFDKLF